jgi:hypothetical protein
VQGGGLSPGTNTTAQSEKNAIKEKILRLILADFKSEISAWLRDHGKGPLDDETLALIMALPECFPQQEDILQHVHDNTIPYYEKEENTYKLRQAIEANTTSKQLLDNISGLFTGITTVDLNTLSEDYRTSARNATCDGIMEELASAINTTAEVDENSFEDIFQKSSVEDVAYMERIYWRLRSQNGGSDNFKNFEWTVIRRAYFGGSQELWNIFRVIVKEQAYLQDTKTDYADFLAEISPDIDKLNDE